MALPFFPGAPAALAPVSLQQPGLPRALGGAVGGAALWEELYAVTALGGFGAELHFVGELWQADKNGIIGER
jgi:hypothetical protein